MLIRNYSFFTFFLILLVSCEPDNHDDHDDNGDNFDRTAMLINWADNIIIPAYDDFHVSLNSLNEAINSFIS